MLTHAQVWTALDRLAAHAGLTPSGLAKRSGLDPTTFNKSKRITPDGRARWPSTESVAKALAATGATIDTFVQLIEEAEGSAVKQTVPLLGLAQAGRDGYFDDAGFPRPARSIRRASRPARAGRKFAFPPSTTTTPTPWRSPEIRWRRSITKGP